MHRQIQPAEKDNDNFRPTSFHQPGDRETNVGEEKTLTTLTLISNLDEALSPNFTIKGTIPSYKCSRAAQPLLYNGL